MPPVSAITYSVACYVGIANCKVCFFKKKKQVRENCGLREVVANNARSSYLLQSFFFKSSSQANSFLSNRIRKERERKCCCQHNFCFIPVWFQGHRQEKSQPSFEALITLPLLLSSKSVSFGFSSEKVGTEEACRERGEREERKYEKNVGFAQYTYSTLLTKLTHLEFIQQYLEAIMLASHNVLSLQEL